MDAKNITHVLRNSFTDQPDDVLFSRKYMSEVADFVEQREIQIKAMRNCDNCMRGSFTEECDICRSSNGFNYDRGWKWDGDSDG